MFGVNWKGLHNADLFASWQANNRTLEGVQSSVGRVRPPADLFEVVIDPPAPDVDNADLVATLHLHVVPLCGLALMQPHFAWC